MLEGPVHSQWISAVAASADFTRALSASSANTLQLWDLESGTCLSVIEGHSGKVYAVAVSANFSRALSAGDDHTLRLWDMDSGACLSVLEGHSGTVKAVVASADFSRALSASDDHTLRLWDLESGACLAVLEGHSGAVWAAVASGDCCRALSASANGTLRLWDLESGNRRTVLEGHSGWVEAVAASTDFSRALSGSHDNTLRLWDMEKHAQRVRELGEQVGSPLTETSGYWATGAAHLLRGEPEAARAPLERAVRDSTERRIWRSWQPLVQAMLADAYLGSGDAERARDTAQEGVEFARRARSYCFGLLAELSLARALRTLDTTTHRAEIEAGLARCDELLATSGAHGLEPFIAEERARLAGAMGAGDAEEQLREAQRLYARFDATGHVARLAQELDRS